MNLSNLYLLKPVLTERLKIGSYVFLHKNLVQITHVMEFSKKSIWIFYQYNGIEYNITKPKNFIIKQLFKNPKIWI